MRTVSESINPLRVNRKPLSFAEQCGVVVLVVFVLFSFLRSKVSGCPFLVERHSFYMPQDDFCNN